MLWTIAETAKQLSVSVRTVQRLLDTGDLRAIRVRSRRMVPISEVNVWIDSQIAEHNEGARARMTPEKTSCKRGKRTATDSTNNRGRRTGTRVTPMRKGTAAAEVQARIATQKRKQS